MLKKLIVAFVMFIFPAIVAAQDTITDMERWEDSVAAAKKAEIAAQNAPRPAPVVEAPEVAHQLPASYFAVLDSFERAVKANDVRWSTCKRCRDEKSSSDRIACLSFYLKMRNSNGAQVMPRDTVEKYALILQAGKATEYSGTEYIIANQYGNEKVKAHAHLLRLRKDMMVINDFLYQINNQKIAIGR
jgi:hypothetical protein